MINNDNIKIRKSSSPHNRIIMDSANLSNIHKNNNGKFSSIFTSTNKNSNKNINLQNNPSYKSSQVNVNSYQNTQINSNTQNFFNPNSFSSNNQLKIIKDGSQVYNTNTNDLKELIEVQKLTTLNSNSKVLVHNRSRSNVSVSKQFDNVPPVTPRNFDSSLIGKSFNLSFLPRRSVFGGVNEQSRISNNEAQAYRDIIKEIDNFDLRYKNPKLYESILLAFNNNEMFIPPTGLHYDQYFDGNKNSNNCNNNNINNNYKNNYNNNNNYISNSNTNNNYNSKLVNKESNQTCSFNHHNNKMFNRERTISVDKGENNNNNMMSNYCGENEVSQGNIIVQNIIKKNIMKTKKKEKLDKVEKVDNEKIKNIKSSNSNINITKKTTKLESSKETKKLNLKSKKNITGKVKLDGEEDLIITPKKNKKITNINSKDLKNSKEKTMDNVDQCKLVQKPKDLNLEEKEIEVNNEKSPNPKILLKEKKNKKQEVSKSPEINGKSSIVDTNKVNNVNNINIKVISSKYSIGKGCDNTSCTCFIF